jgi:glycosyltransferase involved in cell wall biosynthesis
MKDKISIITTFYNCENYILKCINSVWDQEISDDFDIEYILIDDNSEDKTHEIIDIFFKEYGQFGSCKYKIIKTPQNLGCGGARNFGIANSTGNYIMFLDADDYYINNDFALRAYNMIVEHNADIIEFGIKYINQNGERENLVANKTFVINNNHVGNLSVMFYDNLIKFMPWTKILKRSIVETRPYDTSRTFEDIRTTPYWVYNASKIIIANTIEINYRAAQGSIIRENPNDTRLGTVAAIASLFEDFSTNKDILKAMYDRCLVDLRTMIMVDSDSDYFKEMSKLNTKMLSYIYPDDYEKRTFNLE